MRPGQLDQRVDIVRTTQTPDGIGGYTESTSTVGSAWVHVEPVRGQERVIADREQGVQTYRVTGRNQGTWATVATGDVVRWGSLDLNVKWAPDDGRALYRLIEAVKGTVT
jgi:SPP1 family predicted phage head-tail adaptor